jgi:ubiquinone/menaquinone biosynthesis C-methylase UbiE
VSTDNIFSPQSIYPIASDSGAEIARLIDQAKLISLALKGLLPKSISLFPGMMVLDLACGPGRWTTELAYQHRDLEVIGVDCNREVVKYAQAQAKVQKLDNLSFEVMDITQSLDFEENSIDLIHGRFLVGVLNKETWLKLLFECKRVLKPSGVMILTECEGMQTNSPALHQLQGYLFHAFYQQQRTFSLDGHALGITYMLKKLLEDAGFLDLTIHPFVIDMSVDTALYYYALKDMEFLYTLVKPYIVNLGLVDSDTYDKVYDQMLKETYQVSFVGMSFGLTVWGTKERNLCMR